MEPEGREGTERAKKTVSLEESRRRGFSTDQPPTAADDHTLHPAGSGAKQAGKVSRHTAT